MLDFSVFFLRKDFPAIDDITDGDDSPGFGKMVSHNSNITKRFDESMFTQPLAKALSK